MRRISFLAALAGGLLLAGSVTADAPQPIKILAWNLEHFVDPFDDPYIQNRWDDEKLVKSDEVLTMMAEALRIIDADVMAFQEVESDRAVRLFLDTFMPGHDYQYFASTPSMSWHQNVVTVSRFPMGLQMSLREIDITNPVNELTRREINNRVSAVEIRINEDYEFLLWNLHLKAGRGPVDQGWRTAQYTMIHHYIDREMRIDPERNIILIGDFNSFPDSPELLHMMEGFDTKFFTPFAELGFPFTFPADNPNRVLDHAVLNENMMREYVPFSASVATPLPLDQMAAIADHLPIVVSIFPENR